MALRSLSIVREITVVRWPSKAVGLLVSTALEGHHTSKIGQLFLERSLLGKKGRTRARETQGVTCVDDAVAEETIPHLLEIIGDMVRLQRFAGARLGEVCSLRRCDLDRSTEVWFYRPCQHKTEHHHKDRVIAIGPQSQQILLPYLVRDSESCCFSPAEPEERRRRKANAERTTPHSCSNTRGTNRVAAPKRRASDQCTTASYRRAIHRACENSGTEKWPRINRRPKVSSRN